MNAIFQQTGSVRKRPKRKKQPLYATAKKPILSPQTYAYAYLRGVGKAVDLGGTLNALPSTDSDLNVYGRQLLAATMLGKGLAVDAEAISYDWGKANVSAFGPKVRVKMKPLKFKKVYYDDGYASARITTGE